MRRFFDPVYLLGLTFYLVLRFVFGDQFWWLSLVNTFAPFVFFPLPFILLGSWMKNRSWQRFLATGLAVYALVWFGPYFLPKGKQTAASSTFTVLSYNMHDLTDGLYAKLETLEPDIVLLQEVPQTLLDDLPPRMGKLYPHRLAQSPLYKGNAVLSRYPITASEALTGFGEYVPQRLELLIEDRTVAVYNVHLTWPIGKRRLPRRFSPGPVRLLSSYDDSGRNRDLDALAQLLEGETLPFIVGGDFNLSQHSAGYSRIANLANDSFRERGWGWGNTWYLHPRLPPLLRIDYLWHSESLETIEAQVEPRMASDHLAIRASFAFRE